MKSMFSDNRSLPALNLPMSFSTANVTDMSSMFYQNSSLTSLNLSHFNVTKGTDLGGMFIGASNLASLNLTGWVLRNPLPNSVNIFSGMPAGKVVYCAQDPIGNAFGVTCTP